MPAPRGVSWLPEGVRTYPRWSGNFSPASSWGALVADVWTRSLRGTWGPLVLLGVLVYALLYLGSLYAGAQRGAAVHTKEQLLSFLTLFGWGAVALAAVAGAPVLSQDREAGALGLYRSRGVGRGQYLAGRTLAVLGLSFLGVAGPGLLYYVSSFFIFEQHPEGWPLTIVGIALFSLLVAVVVTSLSMGLSAITGSPRAAVLLLVGVFAVLDVLVGDILVMVTDAGALEVVSPLSALAQQGPWLFGEGVEARYDFPAWWGLVNLAVVTAGGLALLLFADRVRGGESA